jgi:hypothetical protein
MKASSKICGACLALITGAYALEPQDWRALHLIGFDSDTALQRLGGQVPALAQLGINVIVLEVDYSFAYRSHPELRRGDDAITVEGARQLVALCRTNGVRVIPQFQCLGHQSWKSNTGPLLTKYPELDLTPGAFPKNEGIYCREWNPLDPRVNQIVFALMDELIDAFQADAFHVGMDEVFLLGSKESPATHGQDPAKLFAKAVLDYHDHLTRVRGVQMLMWADRLLDGKALGLGAWEASECGTAPALELIPKDIILCPWHYGVRETYPSIPLLVGKGFRVLPASWKDVAATKALITYSRAQKSPQVIGHLFTTWGAERKDALATFPALLAGLPLLAPASSAEHK